MLKKTFIMLKLKDKQTGGIQNETGHTKDRIISFHCVADKFCHGGTTRPFRERRK
jgi:hypothetical protein